MNSIDLLVRKDDSTWVRLDIVDPDIVMTKKFSDLENPSSINAAYTINCTLPLTPHNMDTIGHMTGIDWSAVAPSSSASMVYNFNPRNRHECRLLANQSVIYTGYFTIDTAVINDNATECRYECTIYDEMYDVLTKLDYTLSDPADSLDASVDPYTNIDALSIPLTAPLVRTSFMTPSACNDVMSYTGTVCDYKLKTMNTNSLVCEMFGFLPTYRTNDDIDTTQAACLNADGTALHPDFSGDIAKPLTDICSTLIHKDYPECLQNIWKTYDCKPYVWYSSYVQFLIAEIYRVTGYKVDMTTKFFNPSNPYWSNLIRTCKYPTHGSGDAQSAWTKISYTTSYPWRRASLHTTYQPSDVSVGDASTNYEIFNKSDISANKRYKIKFSANMTLMNEMDNSKSWRNQDSRINKYCAARVDFNTTFTGRTSRQDQFIYIMEDTYSACKRNYDNPIALPRVKQQFSGTGYTSGVSHVAFPSTYSTYWQWDTSSNVFRSGYGPDGTDYKAAGITSDNQPDSVVISYEYILSAADIQAILNSSDEASLSPGERSLTWNMTFGYDRYVSANYVAENQFHFNDAQIYLRSIQCELLEYQDTEITIPSMLGEDFNVLEGLTDVIKTFNLVCDVDYPNKKIYLYERGEYFNVNRDGRTGVVIDDWTKYLKKEEDIDLSYMISEYKGIDYRYEDRDLARNVSSISLYGCNAGEHYYDLSIPMNDEVEPYIEGKYNSYIDIVRGNWFYDAVMNHNNSNHSSAMSPMLFIDNGNTGEALDDVDGQLLFRQEYNYPYSLMTSGNNDRGAVICEDSPWEIDNDEYYLPYLHYGPSYYQFVSQSMELPVVSLFITPGAGTPTNLTGMIRDCYVGTYSSEWTDLGGYNGKGTQGTTYGIFDLWHSKWNDILYRYPNTESGKWNDQGISKKVTAYLHIPLDVYHNFDFSHLILIDNNLYVVLSIDEYDYGNGIMKATMIQINTSVEFDAIDPGFSSTYLTVSPNHIALPASAGGNSFSYTVRHSDPSLTTSVDIIAGLTPNWIASWSAATATVSPTMDRVTITYTTNSNYPRTQDQWYQAMTYTDSSDSASLYITNVPDGDTSITTSISVTPVSSVIPNDTQSNAIQYVVTSTTPFLDASTNGSVISNVSFTQATHISGTNTYYLTMNFHDTTGTAGQTQVVTFRNTSGDSCTAMLVRDFRHEETILPDDNGDRDQFLFDYTTVTDPVKSIFAFKVYTNYNFAIENFRTTMYDAALDEYCYDDKVYEMELWDVTDPNNVKVYDGVAGNTPFQGNANTLYSLEWRYARRKSANDPTYKGFFDLICTDSTHATAYYKRVRVNACVLNNGSSEF